MAEFHGHHYATSERGGCKFHLCGPSLHLRDMSDISIQERRQSRRFQPHRSSVLPTIIGHWHQLVRRKQPRGMGDVAYCAQDLQTHYLRMDMFPALLAASQSNVQQLELPPCLLSQDKMVSWCTLFLNIVSKDPPANALDEELDERERNHWFKSKKWAYANLNRLYVRYAPPQARLPSGIWPLTWYWSYTDMVTPVLIQRTARPRPWSSPSRSSSILPPRSSRFTCSKLTNGHREPRGSASRRCISLSPFSTNV